MKPLEKIAFSVALRYFPGALESVVELCCSLPRPLHCRPPSAFYNATRPARNYQPTTSRRRRLYRKLFRRRRVRTRARRPTSTSVLPTARAVTSWRRAHMPSRDPRACSNDRRSSGLGESGQTRILCDL